MGVTYPYRIPPAIGRQPSLTISRSAQFSQTSGISTCEGSPQSGRPSQTKGIDFSPAVYSSRTFAGLSACPSGYSSAVRR